MSSPTQPAAGAAPRGELLTLVGARIGSYRVESVIASGGMGEVYRAVRADDQFEKKVAIKLVKRGLDSDEVINRFHAERQILATLEHPHIATLIDGGVHDGRPYLVMELIEGAQPIDQYCAERSLSLRERLELFLLVCSAVQAAHRALVIHRDLKPSNIAVSESGDVKLLDFGVAKLLADDTEVELTRTGQHPMTLVCAAPEQVRGEPVTTATDVYALGVLLYRLVTGEHPFDVGGKPLAEAIELICNRPATRPSEVVADDKTRRQLRGDLDDIIAMAMRKEPGERYSSVEALADDIARTLDHRPIHARGETAVYLARKFVRRHRLGVAAAVLIAASLAAAIIGTAWQGHIARSERDRARLEARKAERVASLLTEVFEAADPTRSGTAADAPVRDVVIRGERRVRALLVDEPEIRAEMLAVLGRVFASIGLFDRSREAIESSLALRLDLHGAHSVEVAESLHDLGVATWMLREDGSAIALARQALAIRQHLLGTTHPDTAETLRLLGSTLSGHESAELRERFAEALAIQIAAFGEDHLAVADTLVARGNALHWLADDRGSVADYRRALAIRRRVAPGDELAIARLQNDLAVSLAALGDVSGSEATLRSRVDIYRKWLGDEHPELVDAVVNLGAFYFQHDDFARAREQFLEALAMGRAALGDDHSRIALILSNLSVVASTRGDHQEAERFARQALDIRVRTLGEEHSATVYLQRVLGLALARAGRVDAAETVLTRALEIARARGYANNIGKITADLTRVVAVHRPRHDTRELFVTLTDAIESRPERVAAIDMLLARAVIRLARADAGAVADAERAVKLAGEKTPSGSWRRPWAAAHLGIARGDRGRDQLDASRAELARIFTADHWTLGHLDALDRVSRGSRP